MRRSRFSEEQIIGILKDHQAGMSATELCRNYGIWDATFYTWRKKFGGMGVSEAKRLKALEDDNGRLVTLRADARSALQLSGGRQMMRSTVERRGEDVAATLDRACRSIGYPKAIRVD